MKVRKKNCLFLIIFSCFFLNNCFGNSSAYDLNSSGRVDYEDLKILANFWLGDCDYVNNWCDNADFDLSGRVDFSDYSALAAHWHEDTGLIGWWRFDEESGSISPDATRYGNDAIIFGSPRREIWDFGRALELNGIDQYATIENESFFDITGNITISCWIKKRDNEQVNTLVAKGDSFKVTINQFTREITFSCAGTGRPVYGTIDVCDNRWRHIAAVYDGSAKHIYVDGVLDASRSSTGQIIPNNYHITIGWDESLPNQKMKGLIDEVRIYDRALSAEEIRAIADENFAISHYPKPENNAEFQLTDLTLSWTPGRHATSYDIYIGTDFDAVNNATRNCDEYVGNFPIDANSFSPPDLDYESTYYWRVDDVNDFDE